jgi:hypothetical protein
MNQPSKKSDQCEKFKIRVNTDLTIQMTESGNKFYIFIKTLNGIYEISEHQTILAAYREIVIWLLGYTAGRIEKPGVKIKELKEIIDFLVNG